MSSDIEAEVNENFKYVNFTEESGRKIVTIIFETDYFSKNNDSLYFIEYSNEKYIYTKLHYYVLKYITSQSINEFYSFLDQDKTELEVNTIDNNIYTIKFTPLSFNQSVSYFIKAVYKDEAISGETINIQ